MIGAGKTRPRQKAKGQSLMFCDLSIKDKRCVAFAHESGYRVTVLDQNITVKKFLSLPDQRSSTASLPSRGNNNSNGEGIGNLLTRITILLDDTSNIDALKVKLANIKGYDVTSVLPLTEKMFIFACEKLNNIDIITIDTSIGLKYNLSPSMVKTAIRRGLYIEALYGEAVSNESARKFFMSGIADIGRATRGGKNLIISSGAENKFCLRRPYDIINLLSVLGIKNGEETISLNPLNAIAHSKRRKSIGFQY